MLSSVVAWPHFPNNLTLKCHKGNVVLQDYTDQCEFKPKCVLEYRNQSILFFCSGKYMLNDTRIICIYWNFVFQALLLISSTYLCPFCSCEIQWLYSTVNVLPFKQFITLGISFCSFFTQRNTSIYFLKKKGNKKCCFMKVINVSYRICYQFQENGRTTLIFR